MLKRSINFIVLIIFCESSKTVKLCALFFGTNLAHYLKLQNQLLRSHFRCSKICYKSVIFNVNRISLVADDSDSQPDILSTLYFTQGTAKRKKNYFK